MTTNFNFVRNQILHKAFRKAGLVADGESLTPEQLHEAANDLNIINKNLERYRKKLWTEEQLTETLDTPDQVLYSGTTYACIISHTSGATFDSSYWVEIDDDPSATAWAPSSDYTGSSFMAPDGTTSIEMAAVHEVGMEHQRRPIELINRFEDINLPDKTLTGVPEQLYYKRYPTSGRVFLYPIPDRPVVVTYSRIRLPDDITDAGQFPDVPVTLLSYLIYELAAEMAEEYDREEVKINRLRNKAQVELTLAMHNQTEYSDNSFIDPAY